MKVWVVVWANYDHTSDLGRVFSSEEKARAAVAGCLDYEWVIHEREIDGDEKRD